MSENTVECVITEEPGNSPESVEIKNIRVGWKPCAPGPVSHLIAARNFYQKALELSKYQEQQSRSKLAKHAISLRKKIRKKAVEAGRQSAAKEKVEALLSYQYEFELFLKNTRDELLTVAIRLAEEVIGDAFQKSSAPLFKRIEMTVQQLMVRQSLQCFVHPDQFEAIGRLLKQKKLPVHCEVLEDQSVSIGKARIRTSAGSVEVDWKHSFNRISQQLLEEV